MSGTRETVGDKSVFLSGKKISRTSGQIGGGEEAVADLMPKKERSR